MYADNAAIINPATQKVLSDNGTMEIEETTIRYFRDEYDAHIREHACPAHQCADLVEYTIDEEKCTGCTICARSCPVKAITGEVKKLHVIDQEACIKCGLCYDKCRFQAVVRS